MAETIDELQIEINAKASKANDAIDRLVLKLDRLSTSLKGVDGASLRGLANGVERLGTAMQAMNTIKTADFTRLAKNLRQLGTVDTQTLNTAATSIMQMSTSLSSLGAATSSVQTVSELAKSIAKLGYKSVTTAIANIPQLATAFNGLITTLSKAPSISRNVVDLANSMANLSNQGSRVGSASTAMVRGLDETGTSVRKTKKHFGSLASTIGKFYATYFMAIRGIKSLWSSIVGTTDYIEAYNYFNVALGKIGSDWKEQYKQYGYDNAETYADSFKTRLNESLGKLSGLKVEIGTNGKGLLSDSGMKSLGLNIQEITQYASQLASVTNSMNMSGESSLEISKNFTRLAGDISSLFNVDYNSVAKNFQSAILGQSRAVYKYGIDITQATLQQYAYNLGIEKSVKEMTQGEKAQLRYIAILDQSKVSWGDLANTIESPNNQLRMFKTNLKEIGMVVGQLFIPILSNIMPVVNGVSIAFKRVLTDIAGFLNIKLDLDSFGQGYTDLDDELEDNADSFEEATNKAKEYQNQVLGFDEVNKLTDNTSDDSSSLVPDNSIDLTDAIKEASNEYEKVWQEAYDRMSSKSSEVADSIEKAFRPLKNITKYLFSGEIYSAGAELAEWINKGLTNYEWGKVGTFIGKRITGTFDFAGGFANNLDWKQLARDFTSVINNALQNIKPSSIASAINGFVNGIWNFSLEAIKTLDWGELAKTIGGLLLDIDWVTIGQIGLVAGITKMTKNAAITFGTDFKKGFTDVFKNLAKNSAVTSALEKAGGSVGKVLVNAFKSPLMLIPAAAAVILKKVSNYYGEQAKIFEKAKGNVSDTTKDILENVDKVIQSAKDVSDSFSDTFANSTSEANGLQIIADKYFNLAGKIGKTKEELSLLETYKEKLSENSQFKTIIDDENKSLQDQRDAIQEVIDKMKQKAISEAASKGVASVAEAMVPLQSTIDELADKEKQLRQNMNSANDKWLSGYKQMKDLLKYYSYSQYGFVDADDGRTASEIYQQFKKLQKIYTSTTFEAGLPEDLQMSKKEFGELLESGDLLYYKVADIEANWASVNQKLHEAEDQMSDLSIEMDYYAGISSGAISTQTSLYAYQKQKADEAKIALEETQNAANNTKSAIDYVFNKDKYVANGKNIISGIASGMLSADAQSAISNGATKIKSIIDGVFATGSKYSIIGSFSTQDNTSDPSKAMYYVAGVPKNNYVSNSTTNVSSVNNSYYGGTGETLLMEQNALLLALLQKDQVVLSPDADGLFKLIQDKANNYTAQTGTFAFNY